MLTALFLTTSGAVVQTASNGAEAAKMALTDSYDLILMDMQMPILDGYGAIKQLQNQGCKTPIVALTAHAMRSDREKYLNLGCVAYLSKPVGSDELVEKVAAILRMCKS